MKTFKCWLIANFEIVMFLLTVIVSIIAIWGFADIKNENAVTMCLCVLALVAIFSLPTKRGVLQFGKYILMLGGIILLMWGVKKGGWVTDINEKEMFERFITWFWAVFSIATAISIWFAIYTYVNIHEVVSRRMLYRNSNVNLFEFSWLYTLDRFCNVTVSIVTCTLGFIFLIIMM